MCIFNLELFINIMCTYVYSVDDQLMDGMSIFKNIEIRRRWFSV